MKYAKLLAMGCAVALATVGMTGCTKTTADNPDTLHTPLSSASGVHPRRLPLDIPLVL